MKVRIFLLIIYIMMSAVTHVAAQENDALSPVNIEKDTITTTAEKKQSGFIRMANSVIGFFSPEPDTAFIEPQRYNFTAMAQLTNTDDYFVLGGEDEYSLSFAPRRKTKFGPFFGWRWLFLGYTFNINTIDIGKNNIDINTSLYTPAVGIDIVYRNIGDDYKITSMRGESWDRQKNVVGMSIDGLDIDIMSVTSYYVFNSKKYSHQAVFNQTNRQLHNAGSWIVGTGYNQCKVSMDWDRFYSKVKSEIPESDKAVFNDSAIFFKSISYRSIPFSVGYGYNWAFARNWSAGAQLLGSLSYMWSKGDAYEEPVKIGSLIKDFTFSNFTFDGTLRLGVVWNNSRWFAGASAIYHTYHYHQKNLRADNIFGTLNFYVGFNFWRK